MKDKIALVIAALIVIACLIPGCDVNWHTSPFQQKPRMNLVKVEITFDRQNKVQGYVNGLGQQGMTYNGGATVTNLYDAKGRVTGVFNYNRVMYIKRVK